MDCSPQTQSQGKTDRDGAFSVELGAYRYEGASDASTSTPGSKTGFGGQLSTGRTVSQVDGMRVVALMGCYHGYNSRGVVARPAAPWTC